MIEQFLSLFDQSKISTEKRYILDVEEDKIPNPFLDMATHLKKPLLDKDYQRKLELEQELDTMLLRQIRQVERANKKVEELEQEVEEVELRVTEAKLKANEAELKANEAELKANEAELKANEAELQLENERLAKEIAMQKTEQANAILRSLIHGLEAQGMAQEQIVQMLNIAPEQLHELLV